MWNPKAVGAGLWRLPLKVAILCLLLALAFVAGVVVRGFQATRVPGSGWLPSRLRFIPAGNLGPGTYFIPYGRHGKLAICRIVARHNGKGVGGIELDDPYAGDDFGFTWMRKASFFGVPIAAMNTGTEHPGLWIDVGLRGRILIKCAHRSSLTRLGGKWVAYDSGHGSGKGQAKIGGVLYAYDRKEGRWKKVAGKPAGKVAAHAGGNQNAVAGWRKAAAEGASSAEEHLGSAYLNGKGVARSYAKAMEWFRKAVAGGNTNAMVGIGSLYAEGLGVTRNYGRAIKWLRRATARGNAGGGYDIGVLYANGDGVARDYTMAMKWWREAAAKGNAAAMNAIGGLYRKGRGITKNYAEAMKWFRRAAARGNPAAMVGIGGLYAEGLGVAQRYAKAIVWFRKGAVAGNGWGMFLVGSFYFHGQGVQQNYAEAGKWFRRASRSDDREAASAAREELAKIPAIGN